MRATMNTPACILFEVAYKKDECAPPYIEISARFAGAGLMSVDKRKLLERINAALNECAVFADVVAEAGELRKKWDL